MITKGVVCPACGGSELAELVQTSQFPAILFPIEKAKRSSVATSDLVGLSCQTCNHIFLDDIDLDFNRSLYRDYYYLYPYSALESMGDAYRRPFENAFTFLKGNGKGERLLEVGCSSGKQLEFFSALGYSSVGVSPGAESAESCELIDDFYENVPFSQEFDCVVSRFNLEHIVDLDIFFRKVRSELKDGGCFFVQVPNVEAFFESGLLNVFAHEHPHYFCKKSLSSLLFRVGFELEFIDAQGPSIIAMARSISKTFSPVTLMSKTRDVVEQIINVMKAGEGRRFVFYGAGLSLTGLLYLDRRIMDMESSIVLVDDNPILFGRYMPNTNIMVSAFEDVLFESSDVVFVLLNEVYHPRVAEKIARKNLGAVYWLNGDGLLLGEFGTL